MHPKGISKKASQRLCVMQGEATLGAGFNIACRDLQQRGAGNIFGEAQKGFRCRASIEAKKYRNVMQRVAASADMHAAAASFASLAESAGVAEAVSQWNGVAMQSLPSLDADEHDPQVHGSPPLHGRWLS